MVAQNTKLVLRLSFKSVYGFVVLVNFSPFCFMCRCPIEVFIDFYGCFSINPSVTPGHVLRKTWLILRTLLFVEIRSAAWKYFVNYGLVVWDIMLFTVNFYFCVSSGTSCITVCLLLLPLNIWCPLFWTVLLCWSSVMVHPSSHRTHRYMSGAVLIVGKCELVLIL